MRAVFAGPLAAVGFRLVAVPPLPGPDLVHAHLAALDAVAAEAEGPLLVGGVSLGAHLAAEWALRSRCDGLLLAMPAWCGPPGDAPAAVAARTSAETVLRLGTNGALRVATAEAPGWLATELTGAWRRHGRDLADSLLAGAAHPAPTETDLGRLTVPAGLAACRDDPVHPVEVARRWAAALPRAVLRSITLETLGADPESLGRAAVLAWLRAALPGPRETGW
ncbi:thioesterase [Longimycelium tulufanense]|uniref:Thioesterase n=1 Tax=Longimycelium tulufanense TaxID=907463 RepID=A0A8J3C8B2_9PSEU|nr:thioesterase [Longimycelium tulufanense]